MVLHYCYKRHRVFSIKLKVSEHEKPNGRDELVVAKLRGGVCLPLKS